MAVEGGEDTEDATRFCDGGHAFFVMRLKIEKLQTMCTSAPEDGEVATRCEIVHLTFEKLTGWDALDGESWGGLSKEDIACGSHIYALTCRQNARMC